MAMCHGKWKQDTSKHKRFCLFYSCWCKLFSKCRRQKELKPRTVYIGMARGQPEKHPRNVIRNQKYSIITFIPKVGGNTVVMSSATTSQLIICSWKALCHQLWTHDKRRGFVMSSFLLLCVCSWCAFRVCLRSSTSSMNFYFIMFRMLCLCVWVVPYLPESLL